VTDFDKELIDSNLLNATTLEQLYAKEKILTHAKVVALQRSPIQGKLDYAHLKAIHRFIFHDIYTWAGLDRYEAGIRAVFGKGNTLFTPYEKLPEVSMLLFGALQEEHCFKGQNREEFAKSAAVFMNGLNILHPFREGNGRVQRIFMEYIAEHAGYILDFGSISAREMLDASIHGALGDLYLMEGIFKKSLQ
jgi:cell filamentation protein